MKLIRFSRADERPSFGVVVADRAVALAVLQERSGILSPPLSDSHAYLAGLPETEQAARQLLAWGEAHLDKLGADERPQLGVVRLHAPVEVVALFDFGLTPRHLKNSAETMMKYEKDNPQTAPMLQAFAKALLSKPAAPTPGVPERLSYYKCNMNSIVGDGQTIPWPLYTSRLDIEPELAAVYGNTLQPLAGFCIFNDVSARDVQAQEFVGGFCLTKDMDKGNQLGPSVRPEGRRQGRWAGPLPGIDGRDRSQRRGRLRLARIHLVHPARNGRGHGHHSGLHRPGPRRLHRSGRRDRDRLRTSGQLALPIR